MHSLRVANSFSLESKHTNKKYKTHLFVIVFCVCILQGNESTSCHLYFFHLKSAYSFNLTQSTLNMLNWT